MHFLLVTQTSPSHIHHFSLKQPTKEKQMEKRCCICCFFKYKMHLLSIKLCFGRGAYPICSLHNIIRLPSFVPKVCAAVASSWKKESNNNNCWLCVELVEECVVKCALCGVSVCKMEATGDSCKIIHTHVRVTYQRRTNKRTDKEKNILNDIQIAFKRMVDCTHSHYLCWSD